MLEVGSLFFDVGSKAGFSKRKGRQRELSALEPAKKGDTVKQPKITVQVYPDGTVVVIVEPPD